MIAVDLRVLGAAAALAIITGMLAGIVPALQTSKPNLTNALKEGARGASGGRARQTMRNALVVAEVALSVVLLVAAGLFIGSFRSLMKIEPGFEPANVLTAAIQPRLDGNISSGPTLRNYSAAVTDIAERIGQLPDVKFASAIAGGMPLGNSVQQQHGDGARHRARKPGRQRERPARDAGLPQGHWHRVAPGALLRADGWAGRAAGHHPERIRRAGAVPRETRRRAGGELQRRRGPWWASWATCTRPAWKRVR